MASELKLLDGGITLRMGFEDSGVIAATTGALTVFFDDTFPSAVLATGEGVVEVDLAHLVEMLKVIKKNT